MALLLAIAYACTLYIDNDVSIKAYKLLRYEQ